MISIAIAGDLKDRLEVVGEGVDITRLVHCLSKKVCRHAEILKVEEVKDKKPEKKEEKKEEPKPCPCPGPCRCAAVGYCHAPMLLCEDPAPEAICRVM